ncbi:MAG: hypothetical protein KC646_07245 [Candidatus Cloacimonetes bacterium]|nr:hypothetical protein [Candidatus Cloacimonadota bacterium]
MTSLIKDIEEHVHILCSKCNKPVTPNLEEKVAKCPFCNDLFNTKSQLHLLLGEKIVDLEDKIPFQIIRSFPNVNFILICLFLIAFFFWNISIFSYLGVVFIILVFMNLRSITHSNHKKIFRIKQLVASIDSLD